MSSELNFEWQVEEQFRLMVESVRDYAIFMLDPQGYIVTWNAGAERINGYRADEIIGRNFSCLYPPEEVADGKPEEWLRAAAREGHFRTEGWRVRQDGSRFWADVVITALYDSASQLVGFTKITRDLTERMQMEQALHELSSRLLRTQDEERQRIGRDLHDSVGQCLVALKLRLDLLESSCPSENGLRQKLLDCIHLTEDTIREVRTTSYELYPPMLEEVGLNSALLWYMDGFMDRSGIETRSEISAATVRPPREVELAAFRIVQEGLTNIRKHSGSKEAFVQVKIRESSVELEIRDRGKGIPAEVLQAFNRGSQGKLGVGLRGMRERVHQLGGKMHVASSGEGTVVRCVIPFKTPR